jgi:hypothetical protein
MEEPGMRRIDLSLFLSVAVALIGCGSSSSSSPGGSGGAPGGGDGGSGGTGGAVEPSFEELYDQGLTRYVGEFDPIASVAKQDELTTYTFEVPEDPTADPRGPLCLRGTEYTVDTRRGSSDELVIFLQGGGACWESFCSAFETTNSLPVSGILNPSLEGNPVADWDVLYLPYCDGSLFAGDVDRMLPRSILGDGDPGVSQGYQRGLQNLTAALDIGAEEFPNPSRILLTGVSGGAFGTINALPLVRFYYPETEIIVFNDSGVGIAKDGEPEFVEETLLEGWNADSLIPESCVDCTSNGHVTRLIEWQLAADDNHTMSALSFSADAVISSGFLFIPAEQFTVPLLAETERITLEYPERYKRFIPAGGAHTVLLRETSEGGEPGLEIGALDTTIGDVTVLDWFTAHIEGTEDWVNLVDESLE